MHEQSLRKPVTAADILPKWTLIMTTLLLLDSLIQSLDDESKCRFNKVRLSSLKYIKSSPKLISNLQQQFCRDSFIIITNDIQSKQKIIHNAEQKAMDFFTKTPRKDKDKLRGKVELGYLNTATKEGYHIKLTDKDTYHPWPGAIKDFKDTMLGAFECLEDICIDFVDILSKHNYLSSVIQNVPADLNKFEAIGNPKDCNKEYSSSLLSLFYYHNSSNHKDKTNCMEHIDQGFVSLEPFSNVSGLEIFIKETAEWIRIDDAKYMQPNDLILFCSEAFQRLSDGKYHGTMHRVGKNDRPRLSMVYKMRHRDIEKDMKLHFGQDENYGFYQYDQNGNLVLLTSADF